VARLRGHASAGVAETALLLVGTPGASLGSTSGRRTGVHSNTQRRDAHGSFGNRPPRPYPNGAGHETGPNGASDTKIGLAFLRSSRRARPVSFAVRCGNASRGTITKGPVSVTALGCSSWTPVLRPEVEPSDAPGVPTSKRAVSATPAEAWPLNPRHAVLSTPKAPCPPRGAFSFPVGCRAEGAGAPLGRQAVRVQPGPFLPFVRIELRTSRTHLT